MAVQSAQTSVGTTATRLDITTDPERTLSAVVRNRGSAAVFLGGSAVTTGNGYQLDAGEAVSVDLTSADSLYGIVASGTVTCHVLQRGA